MKPEELVGKCVVRANKSRVICVRKILRLTSSGGKNYASVYDSAFRNFIGYYYLDTYTFWTGSNSHLDLRDKRLFVYDSKEELLRAYPDDPVVLQELTEG